MIVPKNQAIATACKARLSPRDDASASAGEVGGTGLISLTRRAIIRFGCSAVGRA